MNDETWTDTLAARRAELVDKKYRSSLTEAEAVELDALQEAFGKHQFSLAADQREPREGYYERHEVCPQCGEGCEQTTVGYPSIDGKLLDRNRATCRCGWVGIVHDLKPKEKSDDTT